MVLIVFFPQEITVFEHEPFHLPHEMGWNATIPGQCHRIQPELALTSGAPNVDVGRLGTLVRVKVESKASDSQNRGH